MKKILLSLVTFLFTLPMCAEDSKLLTVTLDTPHPGHGIEIVRIDAAEKNWHVLVKVILPDPGRMYPMVISSASTTVQADAAPKPLKVYTLNQTWNWGDQTAVKSETDYLKKIGESASVSFKPVK